MYYAMPPGMQAGGQGPAPGHPGVDPMLYQYPQAMMNWSMQGMPGMAAPAEAGTATGVPGGWAPGAAGETDNGPTLQGMPMPGQPGQQPVGGPNGVSQNTGSEDSPSGDEA